MVRAKQILEADGKEFIRKQEIKQISFYTGFLIGQVPLNIYLVFIHSYTQVNSTLRQKYWINTEDIFRLFFFVTLIIFGAASCM